MLNNYGSQSAHRPSYTDPHKLLAFLNSRKLALSSRYYQSGRPGSELAAFTGADPTDVGRATLSRPGEVLLLFAVFEQAFADLGGPDAIMVQDAWDWFANPVDHAFSFSRVCEQIGTDVELARNAIWEAYGDHVIRSRQMLNRGRRRMERADRRAGGGS